jgi:hypothetical protein
LFLPQKVVTAGVLKTAEAAVDINNRPGYGNHRISQVQVHEYGAVRRGKGERLCKYYAIRRLHARCTDEIVPSQNQHVQLCWEHAWTNHHHNIFVLFFLL